MNNGKSNGSSNHHTKNSNDVDIKTDELFVIEKILGRKVDRKGTTYYKVKWKNYPMSECTWEPRTHFIYSHKYIDDYDKYLEAKEKHERLNKPSATHGNIELDIPEGLSRFVCFDENGDVMILVLWKRRRDGFKPEDTVYSKEIIKEHYPLLLAEFYERNLMFDN